MINEHTAEQVATAYCNLVGRQDIHGAVVSVLTTEQTRIVLNTIIEQLGENGIYLPSNEPKQINGLIAQTIKDIALRVSETAKNEKSNN